MDRRAGRCEPEDPLVLVYNRVPKAGSRTLLFLFHTLAERNGFTMVRANQSQYYDHDVITGHINAALASGKKTMIADHFFFPELFDERVRYINVVREPSDWCVSLFYYETTSRRLPDGDLDECVRNHGKMNSTSCMNCGDGSILRYFCGKRKGECDEVSVEEQAVFAIKNMQDHFVVGLTENIAHTLELFESKYPTFFNGARAIYLQLGSRNVNAGRGPAAAESLELLRQRMRHDQDVYLAARRQFYGNYVDCVLNGRTSG